MVKIINILSEYFNIKWDFDNSVSMPFKDKDNDRILYVDKYGSILDEKKRIIEGLTLVDMLSETIKVEKC